MRGRKPKPTLLKDLHGSEQPRNPFEPRPSGDLAEPPAHFNEDQRAIWQQALTAAPPGLLKQVDSSVLETWTIALSLQRRALVELASQERLGVPAAKPLLATFARQAQILLRCASEMGFSPTSRSRVRADVGTWREPDRGDSPTLSLEDYLASAPKVN
jgi:phage terminase small subunit